MKPLFTGINREVRTYVKFLLMPTIQPAIKFVIFGPGRSGSTLLVSLLDSHPEIFCEDEILHNRVLFPMRYVRCRAALSSKNVYGFKLLTYQVKTVQNLASPGLFLRQLNETGFHIIYLWRRNILRHALSNLYARQRQKFHHRVCDGRLALAQMYVDLDELLRWMEGIERMRNFEVELLHDLDYLPLVYEDDLEDNACHQQTADRLSRHISITPAPVTSDLVKIAPPQLLDMVENYEEVVEFISGTRYTEFLEH